MPVVPSSRPFLFIAPTANEARTAAWQFLASQGAFSPLDPPLIFTGTTGTQSWRELAREGTTGTHTVPRLIGVEEFFARFHGANARKRPIRGADRLWVLSNVIRRALPHLDSLAKLAGSRDFASGLASYIAALRRANQTSFPEGEFSADLNLLLRAYEARLTALNAFDFEAAPALFPSSAQRNRAFSWPKTLVIDDLTDPSPTLQIGLQSLFERAQTVVATLICPGALESDNPALLSSLQFWKNQGAQIVRVGQRNAPAAQAAARVLGAEVQSNPPAHVSLTGAHTPWDEMSRIAAQVREQVEVGARPDDFALALADFGGYEAAARHAFASQGVPLDWPHQPSLRSSPLVRGLLRAAQSCRDNWNVHELHDLFGDGALRLQSEERIFDPRRLRAAARAARHPELDDLDATRAAFEAKVEQFVRYPKNDEAPRRVAIESSLAAGDLDLVVDFKSLCAGFSEQLTATAWQGRFLELVARLAGHWLTGEESDAALVAAEAIERLRKAVECVVERARGWNDAEEEPQRSASEWLQWLNFEIDNPNPHEIVRPEGWGGGVRVGSVNSPYPARHTTFFCGLSERSWPVSASGGPLGTHGREIDRALRSHETSPIAKATHVLARAIGELPSVSFSYANHIDGAETLASPLVDDLKSAWNDDKWPKIAPAPLEVATSRRGLLRQWNHTFEAQPPEAVTDELAHLKTLAQMRAQRRDTELGVYDGVLGQLGLNLMERWMAQRANSFLSGSALELYARCPLRYFFERVLNLGEDDDIDDDLDPRAAGTLVHEITRHFFEAWPKPFSTEDFEDALEVLGEITKRECNLLPIRPILKEAEWHRLMGADGRSGPLVKWLKLEMAQGAGAWTQEVRPLLHTDITFDGVKNGLEHPFRIEIGGNVVTGKIDRLDMAIDGSQMIVLDYKTGDIASLPSWKSGDSGLHFQLAVYALAARQIAARMDHQPRLAMAYLSLRRAKIARGIGQEGTLGKGCSGAKQLNDLQFESWLSDVTARAARIADLRRAGTFNIALQSASDAKCDTCSSKTLCGQHQTTQMARSEVHRGSPFVYLPQVWEWEN